MYIARKNSVRANELLESGVLNCFSFGPTMINDGKVVESAKSQRLTENPRTAIGMIEPGHFVAVVADGRQPGYSEGMLMPELISVMEGLGCQVAYNLDGGWSASMFFLARSGSTWVMR